MCIWPEGHRLNINTAKQPSTHTDSSHTTHTIHRVHSSEPLGATLASVHKTHTHRQIYYSYILSIFNSTHSTHPNTRASIKT